MRSKILLILSALLLTLTIGSCTPPPSEIVSLSEAYRKFIKLCQDEYGLKVITKPIHKTLWIYLPAEQSILDYAISKKDALAPKETTERIVLHHLDGRFEKGAFYFEYDISPTKQHPVPHIGYDIVYHEKFLEMQNHLFAALLRTFGELRNDSGEPPPEFIVLVIADIKKGIEESLIFNFEDFKRIQTGTLPPEEFNLRSIPDMKGMESIIGDDQGKHLDYKEIGWPDFLTKVIGNRVRFKYEQSDFPPGKNANAEILKVILEVVQNYHFTDFETIELDDLWGNEKYLYSKKDLAGYGEE